MQHSRAESKVPNASNATGCTNLNTIGNLAGAARQTPRLTRQDWKKKRGTMPPHVQVLELLKRLPNGLQSMSILETQV